MFETGLVYEDATALAAVDLPDLTPSVAYERNGAWAEHDWSNVPVRRDSDEPPADVDPDTGMSVDAPWLDRLREPHLGPVEWLREMEPSARLMAELEALPDDVIGSDSDAVEMVAHWHRMEAYAGLRKREAAAHLARRAAMANGLVALKNLGRTSVDPNIAGAEIAIRIGIGRRAADTLVRSGRALAGVGIPTAEALAAGEIDAAKADAIVDGVEDLPTMAALEVQERVLAKAPHIPTGTVRKELAKAVAEIDPEHFEERCQLAMQKRRVGRPRPLPDGMASVYAVMPAVDATQLYRAVDAAARSAKTAGDTRTLHQLRADALALMGETAVQTGWIGPCPAPPEAAIVDGDDLEDVQQFHLSDLPDWARSGRVERAEPEPATQQRPTQPQPDPEAPAPTRSPPDPAAALPTPDARPDRAEQVEPPGTPPERSGMRVGMLGGKSAHVRVVVPLGAMMGGEGGPGADLEDASAPASLQGYGPIPASVARALAAGGPWGRLVTDPVDHTVLEVSRDVYTPPASMAELVRARDPECVSPSCSTTSDTCDLHHRVPWPFGATTVANLDPECRYDHNLITHGGWLYYADDVTGSRTWRTAAGLTYAEDADGNLLLLRQGKTAAETAAIKAAAEEQRRLYDGPPPF